jgi:glycerol-3-phosphate acyltransferase PlsY
MPTLDHGLALLVGYLIGSLPFGYWVARAHGVDILKVGSGNPGATNVKRVVGRTAGNLVFALDFLKGAAAVSWVHLLPETAGRAFVLLSILGLIGAILGHSFSLFLRFRGGKGVATTVGGMVTLMPVSTLIAILVWVILFFLTRYVSLASIGLSVALPVSRYLLAGPDALFIFAAVLAVFIVYRHRGNIRRLLNGTESRFERRRAQKEAS